jgi:hypothetical protein
LEIPGGTAFRDHTHLERDPDYDCGYIVVQNVTYKEERGIW